MALHFEEMQHVYEDPVLGQFVTVTAVDIDDAHIGGLAFAFEPRISACGRDRQVGPAEKAAIFAFGQSRDMAVEDAVREFTPEGLLVLFDITLDRVGRADASGAVPRHIFVPVLGQLILRRGWRRVRIVHQGINAADHAGHGVDEREGGFALGRVLGVFQKPVMGARPRLDEMRGGLMVGRVLASLLHQVQDIAKQSGLGDFAVFDAVELRVAQENDLACRLDSEPWSVEKPHEMTHGAGPDGVMPVAIICAGKKHVLATLQAGEACQERGPEAVERTLCVGLLVERMQAAPSIVSGGMGLENCEFVGDLCAVEAICERAGDGFGRLQVGHWGVFQGLFDRSVAGIWLGFKVQMRGLRVLVF